MLTKIKALIKKGDIFLSKNPLFIKDYVWLILFIFCIDIVAAVILSLVINPIFIIYLCVVQLITIFSVLLTNFKKRNNMIKEKKYKTRTVVDLDTFAEDLSITLRLSKEEVLEGLEILQSAYNKSK